ncbi:hypothetical protein F5B21DRAFT_525323 [Xylaria acuta]|nr:hypothetical protein F5B21DRAFT_525323 [Xylaria acuta]
MWPSTPYHGSLLPIPDDEEQRHSFHSRAFCYSTDALDNPGVMDNTESEVRAAPSANYLVQQLQQPQLAPTHPLPAQHQLLAVQQSTPPRQYTTVGSVYNPQLQPLQPPVRRGRTIKCLYPYKGEPPAGLSQVQYTPLQQNSDRAVSPVRQDSSSLPATLTITRQERQVLQKFGVMVPGIRQASSLPVSRQSPVQVPRYMASRENNGSDALADPVAEDNTAVLANTSVGSDDGSDATDTKPISAMNFNSLTNLASYPNPMQRAAQKVLASHRPQPVLTTGVSPSNAYPDRRIVQYDVGVITDIGSQSQISDSRSVHYDPEVEPFVSLDEASRFMPDLPKVRGAPAPLTAGPPGVRQLRPTAFEQETLQRARDFDDETPMMNPYRARLPFGQHTGGSSFEHESISDGEEEEDDHSHGHYNTLVFDTLSADEAIRFYPTGLPTNFNYSTLPVSGHWEAERLAKLEQSDVYSTQCQESVGAERKQRIDNSFYSGSNTFKKSFDVAVSDHKHRGVARIVGRPYQEPPNDQGKVVNRQLQIRDASIMPASEHAKPLLSMVFQAISNRPEISPDIKLPRFEQSLNPPYLKH